jgi:long-chain acyl-CoA synthetase
LKEWTTMPTTATPASEKIDEKMLADRAQSVGHLFRSRVQKTPNRVAYWYPRATTTPRSPGRRCRTGSTTIAAGLISLGVQSEDRVALASGTRYEWALADLANMCAGTTTTTIYPTTIADDVAFILADSGSVAASPRTRPRSRSCAASATPSPTSARSSSSTARATATGS